MKAFARVSLGTLLVLALAGCAPTIDSSARQPGSVAHPAAIAHPTTPTPSTTPGGTASPTPTPAAATSWLAELDTVPVYAMLSLAGYARVADFGPAWADVDGQPCDTRDQILKRDLIDITLSGECKVTSGILHDPYTGKTIHFVRGETTSAAVQIDHVVPLANAWMEGAQNLSYQQRELMANDPIELLAVDGPTNESKGDLDASAWLPSVASFDCTYVEKQVAVKIKYHLWMTPSEHAAIARVLKSCGEQAAPVTPIPSAQPAPTTDPQTSTSTHVVSPPKSLPVISPGAFCSTRGAIGVSKAGKTYTCGSKGPDKSGHLHWNS